MHRAKNEFKYICNSWPWLCVAFEECGEEGSKVFHADRQRCMFDAQK